MNQNPLSDKYLIRNSGLIAVLRLLSAFSGACVDAVVLAVFGLGGNTDAFFAALALPLVITSVLEVQIPNILVPVFISDGIRSLEEVWSLLRTLTTVTFITFCVVALILMAVAGIAVPLLVPGLAVQTVTIAVRLFMLLVWLVPIRSLDSILTSALYSRHQYLLPSLSKLMNNVAAVVIVVTLTPRLGIYSLALAYLVGSLVPVLSFWSALAIAGFRYRPACDWRHERVRSIVRLFVYPLAGHGVSACRDLLENFLASFLSAGRLSAFRYASRLVQSLASVFVGGVATPSLSLIAYHAAARNFEAMKESLVKSIKLLVLISLTLGTWLVFMSQPMLVLLFQRGRFSNADAILVGQMIAIMVPYILFSRIVTVCQAPFFATLDVYTPTISTFISFAAHAIILIPLSRVLDIYAFPIASAVFPVCTSIYLVVMIRHKFGALTFGDLQRFIPRLLIPVVSMALALKVAKEVFAPYTGSTIYGHIALLVAPSVVGGVILFAALGAAGIITADQLRGLKPELQKS